MGLARRYRVSIVLCLIYGSGHRDGMVRLRMVVRGRLRVICAVDWLRLPLLAGYISAWKYDETAGRRPIMKTRETLIESTIALWSQPHASGPSMRAILKRSAITAPALYHHFESLQHLYAEAQELALARAAQWFTARLEDLQAGPELGPHALPALMAELVDRWCQECRPLAFIRFECLIEAARQGAPTPLAARWEYLWRDMWRAVAARCGLAEAADGTAAVAAGLSLSHLIDVRRTVDRCCVDEVGRGWLDWVLGKAAANNHWHDFALAAANSENAPIPRLAAKELSLAEAAAQLLIEKGVGEVTHRSVAQQAGVSAGAVAHYYRTVGDLLRAAFSAIYWQSLGSVLAGGDKAPSPPQSPVLLAVFTPPQPEWWSVIGWLEFHLALARDPALAALAARIRYRGGHMSQRFLGILLPRGVEPGQADRALFSHWVFGTRIQIAAKAADPDFYRGQAEWLTATLARIG